MGLHVTYCMLSLYGTHDASHDVAEQLPFSRVDLCMNESWLLSACKQVGHLVAAAVVVDAVNVYVQHVHSPVAAWLCTMLSHPAHAGLRLVCAAAVSEAGNSCANATPQLTCAYSTTTECRP
jgi:hypothetical protein